MYVYICNPARLSTKHPVFKFHAHYQVLKQNTALPIPIQATIAESHYQLNSVTLMYRYCIIPAEKREEN